jgi:tetratricopeptide (TPR) repeat protein
MKKKLAIAVFAAFLAAVCFIPAASPAAGRRLVVDLSKQGSAGAPPKLTPEQTEAIKKQNEKATRINELITQADAAINAKKWHEAIPPLQQLIAIDPTNWEFYSALGDALLNSGLYSQAIDAYEKGVQAAEKTPVDPKNPNSDQAKKKVGEARMFTNEGNAFLKSHKENEAIAAYTRAAALDPNPATAFWNLCATQYNAGLVEGTMKACNRAIELDPSKADAYFIKGSLLVGDSKLDKDGKVQTPPGTVEALKKYLELAPNGPHTGDVKEMLKYIGSDPETSDHQKKK